MSEQRTFQQIAREALEPVLLGKGFAFRIAASAAGGMSACFVGDSYAVEASFDRLEGLVQVYIYRASGGTVSSVRLSGV